MREARSTTLAVLGLWTVVHAGCADTVEESDISYDDRYGAATTMDVYHPPGDALRPAVLLIHGGGWHTGFTRSAFDSTSARLAGAGYVAFNIDYRLVPDGGQFPHAPADCLCALSYIRANAARWHVDPARIAAFGYSAGGHLASLIGVAADDPTIAPDCASGPTGAPAAVVSGAGPEDMRALPQVSVVTDFLGGTPEQVPDVYTDASPIDHVAPGAPPFLFVQGTHDWFVDASNSERMRAALDAVGDETRLFEIPGGGHVWNQGADDGDFDLVVAAVDTPEAWAATIDFLDHAIGPVP
jgi:acetyl esterase/lipase